MPLLDDRCSSRCPAATGSPGAAPCRWAIYATRWMTCGVSGTCPDSNVVLRACREAGFSPQVGFASDDYSAIRAWSPRGWALRLSRRWPWSARATTSRSGPARRQPRPAGARRHRAGSAERTRRCAGGDPARRRARAAVGGAAAGRGGLGRLRERGGLGRAVDHDGTRGGGANGARVNAQHLDDRGGVLERVGDDRAGVERGGGQQPALGLGDEQLAGGDAARVQRGEPLERLEVRRGGRGGWYGASSATRLRVLRGAGPPRASACWRTSRRASVTRVSERVRSRLSLNMDRILDCAGSAHIGQMERLRACKALPDRAHPLTRENS